MKYDIIYFIDPTYKKQVNDAGSFCFPQQKISFCHVTQNIRSNH